jgi:hypothetical protein
VSARLETPEEMARRAFALDDERHTYGPYYCRGVGDRDAAILARLDEIAGMATLHTGRALDMLDALRAELRGER